MAMEGRFDGKPNNDGYTPMGSYGKGSPMPIWTGGRSGNPTQYQLDLKNWKRAQGLLAAPQPVQNTVGLKWSPMSYGPINLTAGSGYGLQPYGMTTVPFRYFGMK